MGRKGRNHMKKRILVLLLALVMVAGFALPAVATEGEGAIVSDEPVVITDEVTPAPTEEPAPTETPAPAADETEADALLAAVSLSDGDAPTTGSVQYVDEDGNLQTATEYTVVASGMATLGAASETGWYVVKDNVTIGSDVTIKGEVHLILCDGMTLTVNGGITTNVHDHLYIYGQLGQTGALECSGMAMMHGSGSAGQMTINGGEVNVTGGVTIDRNSSGSGGSLTVNGGSLNVTNDGGDGIWIGSGGTPSTIPGTMTINGGTVTVKSTQGGKAINQESGANSGRLNCPSSYYWRTAANGKYRSQKSFTDNALAGQYFELTTTTPATDDLYSVEYVDWNSTTNTLNTTPTKCSDPIKITSSTTTLGEDNKDTWYCVDEDTTISNKVTIKGNVRLILCDGKKLTVNGGIDVVGGDNQEASLAIYGQSGQSGALKVNGGTGSYAGISVGKNCCLTVNGGNIEANGGKDADNNTSVGISLSGSEMTVNSGSVTALGAGDIWDSYGIDSSNNSKLTVNGGEVTGVGSTLTSPGGLSAGIYNRATVTINGGKVIGRSDATSGYAVYNRSGFTLTPPTSYYWRTAADGKYKTQNVSYTDNDLKGQYFELTTTKPTNNIEPYVTGATATVTYGDALDGSVIKATTDVSGTFAWKSDVTGYGDASATPRTLTAVFTPSDNSYVSVDVNVSVTVEPKTIGIEWTDTKLTHNGKAQKPTATATGLVNDDQCTITVTGEQTEAGTYTATATGLDNPNYKLPQDVTCEFTIAAKPAEGKKEPPKTEKAPQTGDAGVALYVISALSSMSGLAWLGRKKKR